MITTVGGVPGYCTADFWDVKNQLLREDTLTEEGIVVTITHRITQAVLYESATAETVRAAVLDAVAARADLTGADLADANLAGADLADANLARADLAGANLARADLTGADFADANLAGADLADANLARADLAGANLAGADLADANLARADLTGANLADGKNLATVRADLHAVLDIVPQEVPALLAAVRAGKINGTVYEGECACLVGTIAKARGCSYTALPGLAPDSTRPAERWFLALMPGHTPDISIHAALTVAWIEDWLRTQVSLQRCGAVNENP